MTQERECKRLLMTFALSQPLDGIDSDIFRSLLLQFLCAICVTASPPCTSKFWAVSSKAWSKWYRRSFDLFRPRHLLRVDCHDKGTTFFILFPFISSSLLDKRVSKPGPQSLTLPCLGLVILSIPSQSRLIRERLECFWALSLSYKPLEWWGRTFVFYKIIQIDAFCKQSSLWFPGQRTQIIPTTNVCERWR